MEVVSDIGKSVLWDGDAIGRKPLADYLTKTITNQVKINGENSARGLTVSLDGDWGAGKTFFVNRWMKDLVEAGHPVVYFDAWENDVGEEASVALMAEILKGLEPWKGHLSKTDKTARKASELKEKSIRLLRKAVMPASAIVAKGLLKKVSGVAVDEIAHLFQNDESGRSDSERTSKGLDSALDEIFEKSLKEHDSRRESLSSFKASLSDLIELLAEKSEANIPLFVFVDELDRCRPSYAMRLLEEIKHIFGIKNVAYVVSTNMEQLQNSVRAIYGIGFDGRRYLRRLFDREYKLPLADNKAFAASIFDKESFIRTHGICLGLPANAPKKYDVEDAWAFVSDAFQSGSDLRSQKQLVALLEDVALSLRIGARVHVVWLFFLAFISQVKPQFLDLIIDPETKVNEFMDELGKCLKVDPSIHYFSPNHGGSDSAKVKLSKVVGKYFEISRMTYRKLREASSNINVYDYPLNLIDEVLADFHGRGVSNDGFHPDLNVYPELVRSAGYLLEK